MTEYTKFPAYIDIEYHSPYGVHHMQLKTREWNPASLTGSLGSYLDWNDNPTDAEAMIDYLVTRLKPFFLATTNFDVATIYTLDAVGAPAIPRAGKTLDEAGTSVSTTQAKAAQHTLTFRDTGWNVSRLVFLDAPVSAGFEPISDVTGVTAMENLIAAWTSSDLAFASMADLRPATFRKVVYTLNDTLRRKYGMT